MIYTLIKISALAEAEKAKLDRYWVDPSGKEYYVGADKGTHMQWIFDNQQVIPQVAQDEIKSMGLTKKNIETYAAHLYELGWVRISESNVLMDDEGDMKTLAQFIRRHVGDANLVIDGDKKLQIFRVADNFSDAMSIKDILSKYSPSESRMGTKIDKISSRDAIKDTINYWDKAKNKDFSKYWRKLKKKKKANYIPNPDTKVEQPLKRNYDYGEIPNYVDRLKWFNKKHTKRRNRKTNLDKI
jgi:hypothetical protein